MKYDDASWHYNGEFPNNMPIENGGTHIALFLKWCFIKGWAGEVHINEGKDDLNRVINSDMSAVEFFFKYCDGKFWAADLNDTGNDFAKKYYGSDGLFLDDYTDTFGDMLYIASEDEHNFNEFSAMIENRINSGILERHQVKSKPWWKLW